jgi:hypothetical protein
MVAKEENAKPANQKKRSVPSDISCGWNSNSDSSVLLLFIHVSSPARLAYPSQWLQGAQAGKSGFSRCVWVVAIILIIAIAGGIGVGEFACDVFLGTVLISSFAFVTFRLVLYPRQP